MDQANSMDGTPLQKPSNIIVSYYDKGVAESQNCVVGQLNPTPVQCRTLSIRWLPSFGLKMSAAFGNRRESKPAKQ